MFTECGPVFLTMILISARFSSVKAGKNHGTFNPSPFPFSKLTKNIEYSEFHFQILLILHTRIHIGTKAFPGI
jgi:hypothetical protein